ncbi:response regulator transcription factor [Yinghuangia seranimata]|uniref:response regulator transcription factor n=1 Tax=Yinghuangia seranimata TaxID=408067 RepID=UPI00248CEBFC|nr:response regulator transcription factor [Yinghuangia seranimata]MDI2132233.1 response regulator transcription factor [Yinghuangia seranimata]
MAEAGAGADWARGADDVPWEGPADEGAPGARHEVLVVDDDPAIRRALGRGLRLAGFDVRLAADGCEALAAVTADPGSGSKLPDIVVLDVCLPDLSGTSVCRKLRDGGHDLPILVLSALDEVADRVAGLQAGADDYLVKPFAFEELELRLRALLRRRPAPPAAAPDLDDDEDLPELLRCGPLAVNPAGRSATVRGVDVTLTRREFELLEFLVRNRARVLTRDQILDRVWGYDFDVRSDVVDTFVSYLRRKLEADGTPRMLHTVRGVGFVLREDAGGLA